jgi:hypothetical protein
MASDLVSDISSKEFWHGGGSLRNLFFGFLAAGFFSLEIFGASQWVRWTGGEDPNPDLNHILQKIREKTGIELSTTDFSVTEARRLATSQFTMLSQMAAELPIRNHSIRIWTSLETGEVIQVEAVVDKSVPAARVLPPPFDWSDDRIFSVVREVLAKHPDDSIVREVKWMDVWQDNTRVRIVTVKGYRGKHVIAVSLYTGKVISSDYEEFPQSDQTFSVPVQVYPIYEEVDGEGKLLPRVQSELRYLNDRIRRITQDPYGPLKTVPYDYDLFDPLLGLTVEGRKKGYWAMGYVKAQAASLLAALPLSENSFQAGGVVLDGRYATVNIYPEAIEKFKKLNFTPAQSGVFVPLYQEIAQKPGGWEMIPSSSFLGRPIHSLDDAWKRLARRLPDHDPETYINDGFDEIQVYWSVTRFFESLRPMGFTDPELSTRPFNAFLYYPDVTYRNNAFYTDDTINFTTYTASSQNMARDNTTIWHELGHGLMDRLMGDHIQLADTGGLSEGMADFLASIVVNEVTGGVPFEGKQAMRIVNQTGFHLTNEVHDDGEAYGGAMNDLLESAMAAWGRDGLAKVTDLTLEAMRLSRNHPALTANDWFDRMFFADELGRAGLRERGELRALILKSLAGRNYILEDAQPAAFIVMNGDQTLTSTGPGSRPNPIKLQLAETETSSFVLSLKISSGTQYKFRYPVTIHAEFLTSPLQGAVRWQEEAGNPVKYVLTSESDPLTVPLTVAGKCDDVNRPDGSCVDYVHLKVLNAGDNRPAAKKRFYVRIMPKK